MLAGGRFARPGGGHVKHADNADILDDGDEHDASRR